MAKILLVEDDEATCQVVEDWLSAERHVIETAHDGGTGWYLASNYEYELLILDWDLPFLPRHPNQLFSGDDLLEKVWQSDSEATISAVRTVIARLRKKIGDGDEAKKEALIETIRGLGYRLNMR